MGLGKSKFPGKTGILDRTQWCSTGTTIKSGDQDYLSSALGYTGSNGTDAGFRDQFDGNPCVAVGVL